MIFPPRRNLSEVTVRSVGLAISVVSPADDGLVGAYPASVVVPGVDADKTVSGSACLPNIVATPTDDGLVGTYPARMRPAR